MKIFYWSDYACPYCYIGETNMKAAIKELGLDVMPEMLAFELDPDSPREYAGTTLERIAAKYSLPVSEAEKKLESIDRFAEESGIGFHYADTRYTNTFDAHRITKLARSKSPEAAQELSEALYEAYFRRTEELADRSVLRRAALEAGLEAGEVDEVLEGDGFSRQVRDEEAAAARCGVSAVPFFVIDGQFSIPGALGAKEMASALRRIMALEGQAPGGAGSSGGQGAARACEDGVCSAGDTDEGRGEEA